MAESLTFQIQVFHSDRTAINLIFTHNYLDVESLKENCSFFIAAPVLIDNILAAIGQKGCTRAMIGTLYYFSTHNR